MRQIRAKPRTNKSCNRTTEFSIFSCQFDPRFHPVCCLHKKSARGTSMNLEWDFILFPIKTESLPWGRGARNLCRLFLDRTARADSKNCAKLCVPGAEGHTQSIEQPGKSRSMSPSSESERLASGESRLTNPPRNTVTRDNLKLLYPPGSLRKLTVRVVGAHSCIREDSTQGSYPSDDLWNGYSRAALPIR